jgi:putative endonuclease
MPKVVTCIIFSMNGIAFPQTIHYFSVLTRWREEVPSSNRRVQGITGEATAVKYLQRQGFQILKQNYRYERGEIDIVAEDKNELVFIEVKARHSNKFGMPEEAVTPKKQQQIRKVAEGYLAETNSNERVCRFDVIAVDWSCRPTDIRHYRGAF